MKTLLVVKNINYSHPPILHSICPFQFRWLCPENRKFLHFYRSRCPYSLNSGKSSSLKVSSASQSASYGGWDDLGLGGNVVNCGESNQLRTFLVSVGIDDKKYIFMFLLGVVCAFAITRVRVSSLVVFPASVLVFAVGFSFGFVRGGNSNESGNGRRTKEEFAKVRPEKLWNLVEFFDAFDVKVNTLKNDVLRAIDNSRITNDDLENYVNVIESMRLSSLNARNAIDASIDNAGYSIGVLENQKQSRRRKESADGGFEILHFIGGLFGEKSAGLKYNKVKDNIKHTNTESLANDKPRGNILRPAMEERAFDSLTDNKRAANSVFSLDSSNQSYLDHDKDSRITMGVEDEKMSWDESAKGFTEGKEYSYQNNSQYFMNNSHVSLKMHHNNETRTWGNHQNLLDSVNLHLETEASFIQEQFLKNTRGVYQSSPNKERIEDETYGSQFRKEQKSYKDGSHLVDRFTEPDSEIGSSLSSSSKFADDVLFDKYLTEASGLLKEAKECICGRNDEERAELILYKSAKILSKAIALKPMSLLAVGQLGNTYLLHGELKLHISHKLRAVLSRSDSKFVENHRVLKGLDHQFGSKDEIASVLVNVCEECEELLVKAGKKYKLALSIDGNDVRALYNWGLALSFRAQLIADIGPEAAFDADKVFMAAIDKFDAMMSKGNIYAPDALFRWGMALQHRSRLRPSNSKEKLKLLQQAKRLYEDALDMDSDNLQLRKALSSCLSELSYHNF